MLSVAGRNKAVNKGTLGFIIFIKWVTDCNTHLGVQTTESLAPLVPWFAEDMVENRVKDFPSELKERE